MEEVGTSNDKCVAKDHNSDSNGSVSVENSADIADTPYDTPNQNVDEINNSTVEMMENFPYAVPTMDEIVKWVQDTSEQPTKIEDISQTMLKLQMSMGVILHQSCLRNLLRVQ